MLGAAVPISCSPLGGLCLRGGQRAMSGRFPSLLSAVLPALLPALLPVYVEAWLDAYP